MTFEQPASLNRYIKEFQPPTWNARIKFFKLLLPVTAFWVIIGIEKICLHIWNGAERYSIWNFAALLLTPIWLPVIFMASYELQLKVQCQSKRLFKITDKGIPVGRYERPFIPWSKISAFRFEQIPNEPQLCRLTVERLGRKAVRNSNPSLNMLGKPLRTIILEKPKQVEQLISELKLQQQKHNLNFLIEPNYVSPPKEPRNAILKMSLCFAGLWFLFNAMPLLNVGLSKRIGEAHSQSKPVQHEAFAKFLHAHFSDVNELKHFLIVCGSIFAVVGISLVVSGFVVQRQKND